jgi:hypothetical protein
LRPETAQRVEPDAAAAPRIGHSGDAARAFPDLIPPDPNAPTGPAPAFDSSPMDRMRAASQGNRPDLSGRGDVALSLSERAAARLEETRRLNAPSDARTVDMVR